MNGSTDSKSLSEAGDPLRLASGPNQPGSQQELLDAHEELTLVRLQLNQVQDELEHYFLEALALGRQCERLKQQLQRQSRLLQRSIGLAGRALQRR